jgi:hypothetical protein
MSDVLPDPPVPLDCDLRDWPAMLLDVARLRDSAVAGLESPEAFRAAVLSWATAWHQVPASSLPDDAPQLARMLGYGRDVTGFRKAWDDGGSSGWVKCSDGRLYHRVVAEKALEAWGKKTARRSATKKAAAARWQSSDASRIEKPCVAHKNTMHEASPRDANAIRDGQSDDASRIERPADRISLFDNLDAKRRLREEEGSEAYASGAAAPRPGAVGTDMRTALWRDGVPILMKLMGVSDSKARTAMGKLLAGTRDDCARLYAALREAESLRPLDPWAWLSNACAPRDGPFFSGGRGGPRPGSAEANRMEAYADLGLLRDRDTAPTIDAYPEDDPR